MDVSWGLWDRGDKAVMLLSFQNGIITPIPVESCNKTWIMSMNSLGQEQKSIVFFSIGPPCILTSEVQVGK